MASLTEFRNSAYEQYSAFNGGLFDPSSISHLPYQGSTGPSGNQLDFLFYADQLLNSFATTKNANGDVVLSGKTRDLMDYLPPEMDAGMASFSHSDFLSQAHSLQGMGFSYTQSDASSAEDAWGSLTQHNPPTKAGQHTASSTQHGHSSSSHLPYQGYSVAPRQQMQSSTMHLPAIVKHQEWRLCVKAPTLGTFYLFTDPEKTVAEMIPDIESKIWELYHAFVSVHLVQNDHGIDLPFSCIVSSVLEDRALVCVQYMRTDDVPAAASASAFGFAQPHPSSGHPSEVSASARSPHSSPHSVQSQAHSPASGSPRSPASSDHSTPQSPFLQSYTSPQHSSSGSAPTSPASQCEAQPDTGVKFREPPPAKVLQNREFSFTVSVKNLKNVFMAFNNPLAYGNGQQATNDAESSGAYYAPITAPTTNNPWGAPVPMPIDDADEESGNCFRNFEIPIEVVVEEEGGGILHPRDYRIRCSVLDKQEGLYVFFVKLKKNSHYGRTRFIIKIRRKQPTKQERNLDYLETALLHNKDAQPRLGNDQSGGGRADLLVSHPIVVISKERKTKRKREKTDQN